MQKLAVLLSGGGRTLDNLHRRIESDELDARIELVLSDNLECGGIEKAWNLGYKVGLVDGAGSTCALEGVDLIVLAGHLRLFTPPASMTQRVINIRPSLLPAFSGKGFYGMNVHKAVKERGCLVTGCTVHFANDQFDKGPIILQRWVELDTQDSTDEIAAKVFEAECDALPDAIEMVDQKGVNSFWK